SGLRLGNEAQRGLPPPRQAASGPETFAVLGPLQPPFAAALRLLSGIDSNSTTVGCLAGHEERAVDWPLVERRPRHHPAFFLCVVPFSGVFTWRGAPLRVRQKCGLDAHRLGCMRLRYRYAANVPSAGSAVSSTARSFSSQSQASDLSGEPGS